MATCGTISNRTGSFSFRWLLCVTIIWGFLLPSALAAMDDQRAKLIEGAKKEGKLVIYGAVNASELDAFTKQFKLSYPFIQAEFYRASAEKLLIKILEEAKAKKYLADVVELGALQMYVVKKNRLLARYESPERKAYKEYFKDLEGYYTTFFYSTNVMAYNTKLVMPDKAPKTYEDLLAPQWQGKIGMPTDSLKWFTCMMKNRGEEWTTDLMKKLARQNPIFRAGLTLNTMLLAAGEFPVLINSYGHNVESLKAKGAPIEWVKAEPIISTNVLLALSAHASHPNTAKLFIDFMLSKEGQELLRSMHRIPARSDVDPDPPIFKGLKLLPFDPDWGEDYGRYAKEFNKIFKVTVRE